MTLGKILDKIRVGESPKHKITVGHTNLLSLEELAERKCRT